VKGIIMKIIGLKADGFRKLSAIELQFNQSGITTICGDNCQGKTSVLDTIEYLFRGKTTVNDDIIQHGRDKMAAEIDLGEYTVKRIKTKKTDRLEIVNKEGFKLADKPQAFLDRLINDLTFNPFPFLNKTGEQKLKFMMDFLVLDTVEIDGQIKQTETDRLVCGREGKNIGEAIEVEKIETVSIQELLNNKSKIDKRNDEAIKEARDARDKKVQEAHDFNKKQKRFEYDLENVTRDIQSKESDLDVFRNELEQLKKDIAKTEKERRDLLEKQKTLPTSEKEKNTDIPVDEPVLIDTGLISLQIQEAETTNLKATAYQDYLIKKKAIQEKRDEYETLTNNIQDLRDKKKLKLQNADTGVQGLEIKENGIYFDDIYSENWSDAQGIKIACDLCIAMNPKLRAVFVDRAESIGKKQFKSLEIWAKANDIQCILAKVVDEKPESIYESYKLSRRTFGAVKENLGFSLLYNVVAVPMAMMGFVNPLVAALSMSLSSLVVVGNSMRIKSLKFKEKK